jgi:protein Tex
VTAPVQAPAQPVNAMIARELGVREGQVAAAVDLLDGGATVPFIARYRKEVTGTLDDTQLRTLEERLRYLRELAERRAAILESVRAQGKLDEALEAQIMAADTKARLEDIYLPYKPRRRTRAQVAREAGLEPLAGELLAAPERDPQESAAAYVDEAKGVADVAAALDGARAILSERFTEDADLIGVLRERMWSRGRVVSRVRDGQQEAGAKFADYFEFDEPFTRLPSHRILALLRGEKEEVLDLELDPGEVTPDPATASAGSASAGYTDYETQIAGHFRIDDQGRPGDRWLADTVRWSWRTRILVRLGVDLRMRLWQGAEEDAVGVFAANLRDLLLAAPAGSRTTMGLDPGFRTGVKVAVVDATGKSVATATIYPHELKRRSGGGSPSSSSAPPGARQPGSGWETSIAVLARLAAAHQVELIAIGNGTASRETDRLAADLMKAHPELKLTKIVVSEAGASVYSASEYASRELPGMDVSLRGAVSIARRLQDPLAELVKIDPKSIGVGQYQHDLSEGKLSRSLDAVVEDCVNAVGVDVNTASPPLLARVSGIGEGLAVAIVAQRDSAGPFRNRQALTKVPRLGPKAFEQCAGFLHITGGDDPLDGSSVHPEAYPVVRRILAAAGTPMPALIGNAAVLRSLRPQEFTDERFGLPTVTDILAELEKPGRDPRPAFETASFAEGVETLEDLAPGMVLEGVVTNVAAFGAFVDIGVHQDGLVHVSAMSRNFVSDPREVAKSGDVVRVKVLGVDIPRKRISLTLRLDDEAGGGTRAPRRGAAPASPAEPAGDSGGSKAGGGQAGGGQAGSGQAGSAQAGGARGGRPPSRDSGRRGGPRGGSRGGDRGDRAGGDRGDRAGSGSGRPGGGGGRENSGRENSGQGSTGRDNGGRGSGQESGGQESGGQESGGQGSGGRGAGGQGGSGRGSGGRGSGGRPGGAPASGGGAMAEALRRAGLAGGDGGQDRSR